MRKLISVVMATLILLTMPLNAFATGDDSTYTHEELIQLACDVFPEYTALIRGERNSTYALPKSSEGNDIIFTETRDVSDAETVSISLLSSGDVIIVSGVSSFDIEKQNSSVSTVGSDIIGSTTFHVTSVQAKGNFYLKNVGFIITQGGTGNFTSYGSPDTIDILGNEVFYSDYYPSSTYIHYTITFPATAPQIVELEVYFSNGKVVGALKA